MEKAAALKSDPLTRILDIAVIVGVPTALVTWPVLSMREHRKKKGK